MKLEELVTKLHEALIDDPRGCEHPRFMKPQCERLAAAIQDSIPEDLARRIEDAPVGSPGYPEEDTYTQGFVEGLRDAAAIVRASAPPDAPDPWDGAHLVECGPRCRKDHRKASQEADLAVE